MLSGLLAAAGSLQRPSREALEPRTVRHEQITAANALSSFGMQAGVLVGPAIGGLLIAYVGIGWCYVVNIAGLSIAIVLFGLMRPYPTGRDHPAQPAGIREGIATPQPPRPARDLLRRHRRMLIAFPVVLFPALAKEVF